MTPDTSSPPEDAQPITVVQIAAELGAARHTVETLAIRLRLGTWGRVRKGHGYILTPEEAEQLRTVVRQHLEERRRHEERR